MAALWKCRFAAATLAVRIPFATMLTAANLSQSYQITTHCTSEFAAFVEFLKQSGHPATLPLSLSKEVLLIIGCLAYQNYRHLFSFLWISCSLAWNVSAQLRTWVLGRKWCISATWGRPRCWRQQAISRPRRPGSWDSSRQILHRVCNLQEGTEQRGPSSWCDR